MINPRTRDALVQMKTLLLQRGWTQHTMQDKHDRVCLLGAYMFSNAAAVHAEEALWLFAKKVGVNIQEGVLPLAQWNDEPGRTLDDVVAVIDSILISEAEPADVAQLGRAPAL